MSTTPPVGYTMMLSVVGNYFLIKNIYFHPLFILVFIYFYLVPLCFIFFLLYTEPITTIVGGPDLYIDTGSTVNLTCIVKFLPEPPPIVHWTHNNEVNLLIHFKPFKYINYDGFFKKQFHAFGKYD